MIDRSDPTPLHFQIRRELLRQIRRDRLNPGDQLPPEAQLIERFGVSRQTLRQAVDGLVAEGILFRSRPHGTFVAFGAAAGDLKSLRSISEELRRLEVVPATRLIGREIVPCDPEPARFLEIPAGTEVVRIDRVFTGDEEPIAFDTGYFPHPEFDWLLEEDAPDSWYQSLEERNGLLIAYATQVLSAVPASPEIGALLNAEADSPLLRIDSQTHSAEGRVFNYSTTWFRGDRYHFSVVLPRVPPHMHAAGGPNSRQRRRG